MAEQSKFPSKAKTGIAGFDMTELSKALLTLPRLQAHGLHALLEQQRRTLDFLTQRCEADLALVARIAKAEEATELSEAYRAFWESAAKAYADEAKRSVEMSAKSATSLRDELVELGPRSMSAAA